MSQNALLRSGKGLETPGTTRIIEILNVAPAADVQERDDHFVVAEWRAVRGRASHRRPLSSASPRRYRSRGGDAAALRGRRGRNAAAHPSASFRAERRISGVAVLAESHISIHSWPEHGYAALDIFMCGNAKPDACVPVLREAFAPKRIAVSEHLRGQAPTRRLDGPRFRPFLAAEDGRSSRDR